MQADKPKDEKSAISFIANIDNTTFPKPHSNQGNLFLSGVAPLKNIGSLTDIGVSWVLSVMDKLTYQCHKVDDLIKDHKVKQHKLIDIDDAEGVDISPFFEESHAYIKEGLKQGNVLVHCQFGMSRSASLVIAFLMKQFDMQYHVARKLAKERRSRVNPNPTFEKHLRAYEKHLKQQKYQGQ